MYKNWKKAVALGLAVLIGGMMPMGTMMAAEENASIEISSVSDNDAAGTAAPVIDIKLQGQSSCYALGGNIDYVFVNNRNQAFECSASQNGKAIKFYYYLDRVADITAPAMEEGALAELWRSWDQLYELTMQLSDDQNYVLYVKATADEQTVYARSGGVVVDTIKPEIIGLKEGETYPAGTAFRVTDANLDHVKVNEAVAIPESDGSFKVAANGASCMIRAIDKAGNESTCSITVSGGEEPGPGEEEPNPGDEKPGTGDEKPGPGDEEPGPGDEKPGTGDEKPGTGDETPETSNIISESGVYTLKAGVKYHLAAGKWKVDGDKSVYQGDSDFYVKSDGDYNFKK